MKPTLQFIIGLLLLAMTMLIGYILYTSTQPLPFTLTIVQYTLALTSGILMGESVSRFNKI